MSSLLFVVSISAHYSVSWMQDAAELQLHETPQGLRTRLGPDSTLRKRPEKQHVNTMEGSSPGQIYIIVEIGTFK